MQDWIIILGGRSAALDAAESLDLKVLLLTEPDTAKRVIKKAALAIEVSLRADFSLILELTLLKLGSIIPIAVIAVSEQGVLPAAYLRQYFSLSGQSVSSARDALIKSKMKQRFVEAGLPCWPTIAVISVDQAESIAKQIGYPLIVKALASSGSRGLRKVCDRTSLRRVIKSMLLQANYGGVGIEPFCSARECSVELIIHQGKIVFSNITDYLHPGKTNLLPAKFAAHFSQRLIELSGDVMRTFEFMQGMLHIEFYYDEGTIWIGEVNARPPGGGLMGLIQQAYDFDPWRLVIECQLPQPIKSKNYRRHFYLANWIIHPGKGVVKLIEGREAIELHPLKHLFRFKLQVGQKVNLRSGTGSSVGELILRAKDKEELQIAMESCVNTLKITMTDDS